MKLIDSQKNNLMLVSDQQ